MHAFVIYLLFLDPLVFYILNTIFFGLSYYAPVRYNCHLTKKLTLATQAILIQWTSDTHLPFTLGYVIGEGIYKSSKVKILLHLYISPLNPSDEIRLIQAKYHYAFVIWKSCIF